MKFPKLPERDRTPKQKTPWLLTQIENGVKAVNVKDSLLGFRPVKAVDTKYFEYDRIFGKNAFNGAGILKVLDLFDELRTLTPRTIGYIFGQYNYLTRFDGIRQQHREDGTELFFSDETLRNSNVATFFELNYETNTCRQEVHGEGSEQSADDGPGDQLRLPDEDQH